MLTPQEIQDKKFEKAMFGGYDMGQIDHFLDQVLSDYTSLYKENATLKAKMRVLVDKIEEYRAVDEEMRKTLYTAQVTAKDIVDKATVQAQNLLTDARREADQKIAEMKIEVEAEERRLNEAQRTNNTYINKIKEAMRRNIELMDSILETPQQELLKKDKAPPKGRPAPRDDFEVVLPEAVMEAPAKQAPSPPEAPERMGSSTPEMPQAVTPAIKAQPSTAGEGEHPGEEEELSVYVTFEEAPTGKIAGMMAEAQAREAASAREAAPVREAAPARETASVWGEGYTDEDDGAPGEMETRFFEVELGDGKSRAPAPEDEGDTAKIYGDATFTPKPRFDFSDIRFGKDYTEDDE